MSKLANPSLQESKGSGEERERERDAASELLHFFPLGGPSDASDANFPGKKNRKRGNNRWRQRPHVQVQTQKKILRGEKKIGVTIARFLPLHLPFFPGFASLPSTSVCFHSRFEKCFFAVFLKNFKIKVNGIGGAAWTHRKKRDLPFIHSSTHRPDPYFKHFLR